jgi:hypothetical protein
MIEINNNEEDDVRRREASEILYRTSLIRIIMKRRLMNFTTT